MPKRTSKKKSAKPENYELTAFDKAIVAAKVASDVFKRPIKGYKDAQVAVLENKYKEL
jgi:hypothetical protein